MPKNPYDPFKTWLTRPVRIGIMFFLIALFFIISPLLLLYTTGWRWNFSTWEAEATGVLSIDTLPEDAAVFLNEKLIGTAQPLRLASLVPGIYQVKISKDGYYAFNTDVTVRSHETTYIRNTTLFAINSPILVTSTIGQISNLGITTAKPLSYRFVSTAPSSTIFAAVNNRETVTIPISKQKKIMCAQTKNYCLFFETSTGAIQLVDLTNPQNQDSLTVPNLKNLEFNETKNDPLFYAETPNQLTAISNNTQASVFSQVSSSIWFAEDNQTWAYTTGTLRAGTKAVAVPIDTQKIITVQDSFSILQTKEGLTIVTGLPNNPTLNSLPGYVGHNYHEATNEWRLWSPWEISSVYNQGNRAILYRSAEAIQFVKALEPAGVLLIVQNNKLTAFNPGYYASQELAHFDTISDLDTDEENRLILVAGTWQGQTGIFSLAY